MVTKEYTVNALMKLTTRFANSATAIPLIHKQLATYSGSMSLELQQRAVEYTSLLKMDSIRAGVLERMPAFAKRNRDPEKEFNASESLDSPSRGAVMAEVAPAAVATVTAAAPAAPPSEMDLLSDLLGTSSPAPPAASGAAAAPPPAAMGMDSMLMDLLGGGSPAPAPAPAPGMDAMAAMMGGPAMNLGGMQSPPPAAANGGSAPFSAFNKNGLLVTFACSKDPSNPSVTTIEAAFTNSLQVPISALNFQVAVPKFMKLQMSTASANVVPPNNSGTVTQVFKVANSLHGQKPILVRIKLDCNINGQPVSETGQVDSFPPGI